MKFKIDKLVKITWLDAFHPVNCKWTDLEELEEFIKDESFIAENVGWIVHKNKDMTTIASMVADSGGQVSHIERIPNGCIKEIKQLK